MILPPNMLLSKVLTHPHVWINPIARGTSTCFSNFEVTYGASFCGHLDTCLEWKIPLFTGWFPYVPMFNRDHKFRDVLSGWAHQMSIVRSLSCFSKLINMSLWNPITHVDNILHYISPWISFLMVLSTDLKICSSVQIIPQIGLT